jgi:hypothetical protein
MSQIDGFTMNLALLAAGLLLSGYGLLAVLRGRRKISFRVTARNTPGLRGLS